MRASSNFIFVYFLRKCFYFLNLSRIHRFLRPIVEIYFFDKSIFALIVSVFSGHRTQFKETPLENELPSSSGSLPLTLIHHHLCLFRCIHCSRHSQGHSQLIDCHFCENLLLIRFNESESNVPKCFHKIFVSFLDGI